MLMRRLPSTAIYVTTTVGFSRSFPPPHIFGAQTANSLCFNSKFSLLSSSSSSQTSSEFTDLISEEPSKRGPLKPGLYLVGTPIGNLEDITLPVLRVLKSADVILS